MAPAEVIAAARDYFAAGWQVIAVRADKRPWGKDWRRVHNLDEVIKLLEGPDCVALGFLGGELNYWIVPIDFDNPVGDEWFRANCTLAGIDPDDFPTVLTSLRTQPDGCQWRGRHRYMSDIKQCLGNATGPLLKKLGIDIRGAGMCILPPSPHARAPFKYEWEACHSLADFTESIPPVPDFLYEAIEARQEPAEPGQGNGADPEPEATFRAPPPPGGDPRASGGASGDYQTRAEAYCRQALANSKARLLAAPDGHRNAELNTQALGLGHLAHFGVFGEGEALSALMAACEANGLMKDPINGGPVKCHATFYSGWNDGIKDPWPLPDDEPPRPGFGTGHAWTGDDSADQSARTDNPAGEEAAAGVHEGIGEEDFGDFEGSLPPPRGWLLGNVFARKFISSLLAAGGTGKTAVRIAQALALASDQNITGEHIFVRSRVLYVCLEDDRDELWRRILAAMKHHHIEFADIRGWLFVATPSLHGWRLAHVQDRQLVEGQLGPRLEATIVRRKIDLIILDPFVKSHAVEENDNNKIDFVANLLAKIAYRHDCALDVPHHIAKGLADPGNSDKGRGASSFRDAFRLGFTLATMTPEEAEPAGISEIERRHLVRMDSAKVNITPPLDQAKWFKIVSVSIGNANETYPHGDEVQTVEQYKPPGVWHDVSPLKAREILLAIDKGLSDGRRYSDSPTASDDLAAWRVVQDRFPDKNKKQCRSMVNAWLKSGVLVKEDYHNPVSREEAKGLRVIRAKMPSVDVPD